jgi:Ca2+-binding EF-hand superfamily protein
MPDHTGIVTSKVFLQAISKLKLFLNENSFVSITNQSHIAYEGVLDSLKYLPNSDRWAFIEELSKINSRSKNKLTRSNTALRRNAGEDPVKELYLLCRTHRLIACGIEYRKLFAIKSTFTKLTGSMNGTVNVNMLKQHVVGLQIGIPDIMIAEILDTIKSKNNTVTHESIANFLNTYKYSQLDSSPQSRKGDRAKTLINSSDLYPVEISLQTTANLISDRIKEKYGSMHKTFQSFDADNDGIINCEQFAAGLESLNLKILNQTVEILFKLLDKGKKNYLTYHDFSQIVSDLTQHPNYETVSSNSNSNSSEQLATQLQAANSYIQIPSKLLHIQPISNRIPKLRTSNKSHDSLESKESPTKSFPENLKEVYSQIKSVISFPSPVTFPQDRRASKVPKLALPTSSNSFNPRHIRRGASALNLYSKLRTSSPSPSRSVLKSSRDKSSSPSILKLNRSRK